MSGRPYDWAQDPGALAGDDWDVPTFLRLPAALSRTGAPIAVDAGRGGGPTLPPAVDAGRLERALLTVLYAWEDAPGPLEHLAEQLAAVARPIALAELLHRLAEEAGR